MEIWWWIKPLLETGFVLMIPGVIAFYYSMKKSDRLYAFIIALIFFIPIILGTLSMVAYGICFIFHAIWSPYF